MSYEPLKRTSQRVAEAMADEALGQLRHANVIGNAVEKGRARENVIRDFIRDRVPAGFAPETGFVIDSTGGESRQQDIVITRRDYHPVFSMAGIKFFPVEAVAATVEVKSTLTGPTLTAALKNIRSVKRLDRTAGGQNYFVAGGFGGPRRAFPIEPENHENQVFSVVVAASSSGADSLVATLQSELANVPRREWPNLVAVADEWTLGYDPPPETDLTRSDPMTGTRFRVAFKEHPDNVEPLLDVAQQLWSFLRVSPLIDVQPSAYVDGSYSSDTFFPLPSGE